MSPLAKTLEWSRWLLFAVASPLAELWRLMCLRIHQVRIAEKMGGPRAYPLVGNALGPKSVTARGETLARQENLSALRPCWRESLSSGIIAEGRAAAFNARKHLFVYFVQLMETYGKTFRYYLGPMLFVYTRDQNDLEVILSGQKFIEKNFVYKFAQMWIGTGLITSGGNKWRQRRKLLTPAFHFKILEQFIPVINNCGEEFVKQLRRHADGKVFDVFHPVQLLTLDIICESAMGVAVNAQIDSNSNYVNAMKKVKFMTGARIFQPWYFLDFIFLNSPSGREYKKALKIIHGTTDKVIQERKTEIESMNGGNITLDVDGLGRRRRLAFLDLLLLSARDGSLSDADIREEVDTFMFAGQDTTAAAISYTIFLLSRHTDVQENILDELKSIFDPQQPLRPSLQQLSELKYLEMVVKESLRLYPPVPHFNRWNPEDTKLACGHIMPQGSSISIVPYSLHRDPEVFPEPERFIPERFSPEESARRHPYAYIPFSAGPRNCIGQRFAMLEMKSVLAKVVWNFHLLPAPDFEPELSWEIILVSVNGIQVQLKERRSN